MYKFTGFTQKANDVLNAAIEYAENMGHTYIGSEHLLLGLLTQNGGIAYTVLINKKLTAGKVEDAVRNSIGFGVPTVLTPGDFTPRCKNIIESAMIQARDMGHNYVGTEHLLIAMIKEGSSAAFSPSRSASRARTRRSRYSWASATNTRRTIKSE